MQHPPRAGRPSALAPLTVLAILLVALIVLGPLPAETHVARANDDQRQNEPQQPYEISPILVEQAESTNDLSAYANDAPSASIMPVWLQNRRSLLAERTRLRAAGSLDDVARLNSTLASEAFERAATVTTRWLDRRDPATGLFAQTLRPDGRYWTYGDVGSDLFPFLAISTRYLLPDRYDEILATLDAERHLTAGFPRDVHLDTLQPVDTEPEKAMLGVVEYAKDGLLPMIELLGPDPWLPRLREIMDAVIVASDVPTPAGPIPSPAAEVNGSALQALARLSWATNDPRYLEMGRRIASAYLDHALPTTEYLPPHRWDFVENEPIGPRRFYLGDHGNEIVAGLVEWHRVEVERGLPEQTAHGEAIDKMLDRLLQKGRTPEGLWYELIDVPTGKVRDKDLTDNWGYLGQAYLNRAETLRADPAGSREAATRYEGAASTMLRAVTAVDFYAWEHGQMDGYADTLESALYLLRYLNDRQAADWVDEQVGVLYGYQKSDGSVTDENIDGNFVRTVMLYGLSLTAGTHLEPWQPTVALGAVVDGPCLRVHLHTEAPWTGKLRFDTPRHLTNFDLPTDYPRLNQWPEWWTAMPGQTYTVTMSDGLTTHLDGSALADGLQLNLVPDTASQLQVCPA
jgi:hypothetical protein